jgi:hypothetical protein
MERQHHCDVPRTWLSRSRRAVVATVLLPVTATALFAFAPSAFAESEGGGGNGGGGDGSSRCDQGSFENCPNTPPPDGAGDTLTGTMPNGQVGAAYSWAPTANFGITPGTCTTSAPLPAGLSLDPSTGAVTGTPTQAGTYSLTVSCNDDGGPSSFGVPGQPQTITIAPAPTPPAAPVPPAAVEAAPTVTGAPSDGTVGAPYSWTPTTTGTITSCSLTGTLPPGIGFDPGTASLSGSPTTAGSYPGITITCSGPGGSSADGPFTITVAPIVGAAAISPEIGAVALVGALAAAGAFAVSTVRRRRSSTTEA